MDDGTKQKLLAGFAVSNLVTVGYVMFRYLSSADGFADWGSFIVQIVIGEAIGLVFGAIAFVVTPKS